MFAIKGETGNMTVAEAVDMIRATPVDRRSSFAKEIWSLRRQHYGVKGRSESPPF